ncbi:MULTISPECIES: hypothetical protein [unclassified Enterococcus]|uniref:hypothetical protein n=1 Tax=unclassified Enterococcus TaxID=2608891 RepID=UPI001CE14440|nr:MULTISPECIES: hypothetical protein [unclassified Enterococcus]MCA5014576.1 hypothetical protein [Enterococcus sp. S23]MCA5017829.1 hypothetical protein [Enterococcus sp. S22(2020)]
MLLFAFSGMGKTTLAQDDPNIIDLETLKYEWIYDDIAKNWHDEALKGRDDIRKRNPDFPKNYVDFLEKQTEQETIFLCPTNELVIDELIARGYSYTAIYPTKEAFNKYYIDRFKLRGNSEAFTDILSTNFDDYIRTIRKGSNMNIEINNNIYLKDVLRVLGVLAI